MLVEYTENAQDTGRCGESQESSPTSFQFSCGLKTHDDADTLMGLHCPGRRAQPGGQSIAWIKVATRMKRATAIEYLFLAALQPLKTSPIAITNVPALVDKIDGLFDAIENARDISGRCLVSHQLTSFRTRDSHHISYKIR